MFCFARKDVFQDLEARVGVLLNLSQISKRRQHVPTNGTLQFDLGHVSVLRSGSRKLMCNYLSNDNTVFQIQSVILPKSCCWTQQWTEWDSFLNSSRSLIVHWLGLLTACPMSKPLCFFPTYTMCEWHRVQTLSTLMEGSFGEPWGTTGRGIYSKKISAYWIRITNNNLQ